MSEQVLNIPTCKALFLGFLKLGLMGFGGVLPLAHRMIVEENHWLSTAQFTDLLGVCQILPGGNIINMSVAIGMEFHGVKGALCAILGLICAPTIIVLLIYQIYSQFQNLPAIQHAIQGLAAAAAGLLFSTGLKMLKPVAKSYLTASSIVLTFMLMVVVKIPLLFTLMILLGLNMWVLSLGAKRA
ncbi:chromate transporter [Serratia sp. S1B]|nr:chromate transporter [Serratia sp. S1B]